MGTETSHLSGEQKEEVHALNRDAVRAVVINLVFIAILIGLYLLNRSQGFLDRFLEGRF